MRKLLFLKIPFGFDLKFNNSDEYECNWGQNYENIIWELFSLLELLIFILQLTPNWLHQALTIRTWTFSDMSHSHTFLWVLGEGKSPRQIPTRYPCWRTFFQVWVLRRCPKSQEKIYFQKIYVIFVLGWLGLGNAHLT